MDEIVPEIDVRARAEIERLRAELERRTEAWRDALRLVSETEARCLALEDALSKAVSVQPPSHAAIDWAGMRASEVSWSAN